MKRLGPVWFSVLVAFAAVACSRPGVDSRKQIGELNERIAKLEKTVEGFAKVEAFVRPIMEQQQQAEAQEAEREPDPDARFAVSVAGNAYDGPAGAAVTIVEAFDFA